MKKIIAASLIGILAAISAWSTWCIIDAFAKQRRDMMIHASEVCRGNVGKFETDEEARQFLKKELPGYPRWAVPKEFQHLID